MVLIEKKLRVDAIANSLGRNYQTVKADLMKMTQKNYFPGGYFDESAGGMVFPYLDPQNENPDPVVKAETKVVKCKGCGASNTLVEGTGAECEYCGAALT